MRQQHDETTTARDSSVDIDRDRALVLRCQDGDATAFAELYTRYSDRLFRFCLRRLTDHQEAEDVAQEAFAKAWRALPRFAGERRFYPWLTVIAGNLCTDVLRRRARTTPTADVDLISYRAHLPGHLESAEERVVARDDGELVQRALGRLTPRHRHVLELREEAEWSYQQIATHEGVDVSTIETLLWRARQALKREYAALADARVVLGAVFLGGLGAFRRLAASAGRRAGQLQADHPGLRDAAAALALTSAVAGAAALPPPALSSAAGRPTVPAVAAVTARAVGPRSPGAPLRPVPATTPSGAPTVAAPLPQATVSDAGSGAGVERAAAPTASGTAGTTDPSPVAPITATRSPGTPTALPTVPPVLPSLLGSTNPVPSVVSSVGAAVSNVAGSVAQSVAPVTSVVTPVVGGATGPVSGVVGAVTGALSGVAAAAAGTAGTSPGTSSAPAGGSGLTLPGLP